ncbi:hypothetical protein B0H34DRAFT_715294 [Crassisporium funariophilum]|nr:hypothetical protein B0H34DRAFT_715294 [Crassisporium funariophilum]
MLGLDAENAIDDLDRINTIPLEILGDIFIHYMGLDNIAATFLAKQKMPSFTKLRRFAVSFMPDPTSTGSPFLLTHVCKHWNSVALSMPTLWSFLHTIGPKESEFCMIRLWFERSQNSPISLCIYELRTGGDNGRVFKEMMVLLLGQVHRWRFVELDLSKISKTLFSESLIGGTVKILEHLQAKVTGGWDAKHSTEFSRVVHSSPKLRTLYWHDMPNCAIGHIPWSQLRHIRLYNPQTLNLRDLVSSFSKCMELDTLVLSGSKYMYEYDVSAFITPTPATLPRPSATLPRLRYLELSHISDLEMLSSALFLPALRVLEIGVDLVTETNDEWPALLDMLTRSSCLLESLSYQAHRQLELSLEGLTLPCFAQLKTLKLDCDVMTHRTLTSLTYLSTDKDPVLPHLTRLQLGRCTLLHQRYGGDDKPIVDLARSRFRGSGPSGLKYFGIMLREPLGAEAQKDMDRMSKDGLETNIKIEPQSFAPIYIRY